MSTSIKSFFLVALFASLITLQFNLDSDVKSTMYLKNYGEIAVHDAALSLDPYEMAEGYYVFSRNVDGDYIGDEYLDQSLQRHLRLKDDFSPKEESFFQSPINIVHLKYIDDKSSDDVCDQINEDGLVEFPCTYTVEDYDFTQILRGPSVVAILETNSPRYFRGESKLIRQAAIYEYVR